MGLKELLLQTLFLDYADQKVVEVFHSSLVAFANSKKKDDPYIRAVLVPSKGAFQNGDSGLRLQSNRFHRVGYSDEVVYCSVREFFSFLYGSIEVCRYNATVFQLSAHVFEKRVLLDRPRIVGKCIR